MAVLLLLGSGALGLAVGRVTDLVARQTPRTRPWHRSFERPRAGTDASPLLIALATGVLFVAVTARFGAAAELPAFWLFTGSLVALSIIDIERRVVPTAVVYPAAFGVLVLLGVAASAEGSSRAALDALVGAGMGFGVLLAIHLVKPTGMGFGDVRLGGLIGLCLGFLGLRQVVVGLFLAFFLVAVAGGALIVLRRASRHAQIPFVPFLAAGALVTLMWGGPLARFLLG